MTSRMLRNGLRHPCVRMQGRCSRLRDPSLLRFYFTLGKPSLQDQPSCARLRLALRLILSAF